VIYQDYGAALHDVEQVGPDPLRRQSEPFVVPANVVEEVLLEAIHVQPGGERRKQRDRGRRVETLHPLRGVRGSGDHTDKA